MEERSSLFDFSLDDVSHYSSIGPISTAISNNLFGINHRQTPSPVPLNRDHYGLAFFTRPQLNLQDENIRNFPLLLPFLTKDPTSYQLAIRNLLDPRVGRGWGGYTARTSDLIDQEQAFIPILTNHLISLSGFRDIEVPSFSAPEGVYKEGYSMPDGLVTNYTTYDITATFRNSIGDPITMLFFLWAHYMGGVVKGTLMPYPDFLIQNIRDYDTAIYRLVLDRSKTKVQRIARTIAFPLNVPIGGMFDFSIDKPYNDANSEIAIQFRCHGAEYNDDRLVFEFNKVSGIFNAAMKVEPDLETGKLNSDEMVKIDYALLQMMNYRGYPYINPCTYELDWYVQRDVYEAKVARMMQVTQSLLNRQGSGTAPMGEIGAEGGELPENEYDA